MSRSGLNFGISWIGNYVSDDAKIIPEAVILARKLGLNRDDAIALVGGEAAQFGALANERRSVVALTLFEIVENLRMAGAVVEEIEPDDVDRAAAHGAKVVVVADDLPAAGVNPRSTVGPVFKRKLELEFRLQAGFPGLALRRVDAVRCHFRIQVAERAGRK